MSRSMRSSMAESVHSLMDSMGDDEFLSASPFHPKNLELRRAHRETNANKTAFQPTFCRVDSMAYYGRGIVEDNDHVAPVACSPPPPRSRPEPAPPTSAQRSSAATASGTRASAKANSEPSPLSHPITGADCYQHRGNNTSSTRHATDGVPSASRRRSSLLEHHGHAPAPVATTHTVSAPPQLSTALHVPAPPSAAPPSSSRNGLGRRPSHAGGLGSAEAPSSGSSSSDTAGDLGRPKALASMSRQFTAPLSPANFSANAFSSPATTAQRGQRHMQPFRPPRAPATTQVTETLARRGFGDGGQRNASHAERLNKVDVGGVEAPPSPSKASERASAQAASPSLRGIVTAASSSSQSSVPPLPALSLQGSSDDTAAMRAVHRRNSSPAHVRRNSALAVNVAAPSHPASALTIAEASGSSNDFGVALAGTQAKAMTSSASSTQNTQETSPPSARRSSVTGAAPMERQQWSGKTAPASLRATSSVASPSSAVPSVVSAATSVSSNPSSPSPATTPAATPSRMLYLMADRTPPSRLNGASRLAVTARPTSAGGNGSQPPAAPPPPPPPPPPPSSSMGMPSPVALRTASPQEIARANHGNGRRTSKAPTELDLDGKDSFLNKIKAAQRRRSLLDDGGTSMSDSVRRQYYCLPSTEETSMPTFARRAGDLHVKPNEPRPVKGGAVKKLDQGGGRGDADAVRLSSTKTPTPMRSTSPSTTPNVKESSAVRKDYFLDGSSPTTTTGESSQTPAWSLEAERFVLPEPSDVGSEGEGSSAPMEPLVLDALRAFNNRFRGYSGN